jgi:antitoxin FitA
MATLTIRNVDEALKTHLRIRAAEHGRSMEEEVRCILRQELIKARFGRRPWQQAGQSVS